MSDEGSYATLDIGSNTIRLLVARRHGAELLPVRDNSQFVRLGRGVDMAGELQPDREQAGLEAIKALADEARACGAEGVVAIATSAVRDARNGQSFVRRVRDETGVEVEIISGEREAYLTYLGASMGVSVENGAIVCDLGGGSAELIHADASGVRWAFSRPLGSGRLTERFIHHDPPTAQEQHDLAAHVRGELQDLPPARARTAILTGGTAAHVAIIAGLKGTIEWVGGDTLERVLDILNTRPAAEIVSTYAIRPERAQVLPAGVGALLAITQHYAADQVVITQRGIREGAIVDALRREGKWPGSEVVQA
ncbi:MAG: hypothetical protein JOZ41_20945 [Chloroflexi bacterium]|nr:hypothetical protein [Chloroflexota bacterium]